MWTRPAFALAIASAIVLSAAFAACSGGDDDVEVDVEDYASPSGYWEGDGTASETPLEDGARTLKREADFEFWFSLADDGTAAGEITLTYDALLTVDGLPDFSAPGVGGVSVSFNPEVGGELTDADPTRVFPLVGVYSDDEGLILAMVGWEEADPLEFTLRADPGVSAGFDVGGAGTVGIEGEGAGTIAYEIDMTPFTPFGDADYAEVEKRPGGPYAAHFEVEGDNYAIEWEAVQASSDTQTVDISDTMQEVLDNLH